jgi:hypothetical protein
MAEKFTTFPDIPINIEYRTQEEFDQLLKNFQNRPGFSLLVQNFTGPITRQQLFDLYWAYEYQYNFSLNSKYVNLNKSETKKTYTSVQRKGQKMGQEWPILVDYTIENLYGPGSSGEAEIIGELTDNDPRKALISYFTATAEVASGDNFLAKGLLFNTIVERKIAKESDDPKESYSFGLFFGNGIAPENFRPPSPDLYRVRVGPPYSAIGIHTKITNPTSDTPQYKLEDKYYLSSARFNGNVVYNKGSEEEESQEIIRSDLDFFASKENPLADRGFKEVGSFNFFGAPPLKIFGYGEFSILKRVPATGDNGEIIDDVYVYERGDTGIQSISVNFTTKPTTKFNFDLN